MAVVCNSCGAELGFKAHHFYRGQDLCPICLKSIEAAVGGQEYARLRIGVGPEPGRERGENLADYVLDRAGKRERQAIEALFPDLVALGEAWIYDGSEAAMNRFNRKDSGRET